MSVMERVYEELKAKNLELEREQEALKERLQIAEDHLEVIAEESNEVTLKLNQYLNMFPCSICGKPMGWQPNDTLGQALKAFVKEKRYGHGPCVNPQRR